MHRHGYKGRKLSRDTAQRTALIRGQLTSLVLHERITTTEPKAKEIAPALDRLVTSAKHGKLHNLRSLRSILLTETAARKLVEEIAPAMAERSSGYTRIIKLDNRRGDNAPMAMIELILPEKLETKKLETNIKADADTETPKDEEKSAAKKKAVKKPAAATEGAK